MSAYIPSFRPLALFRARSAAYPCPAPRLPLDILYAYIAKGERMTSIKPPSSGSGLNGPQTLPDVSDSSGNVSHSGRPDQARPDASPGTFGAALSSAQAPVTGQTVQANALAQTGSTSQVSGTASDPISQLAHAVESGSVTVDQAVEQLLGQTLQRAQKQLTQPQLAELSELLRDALLSDPTLGALRSDRR